MAERLSSGANLTVGPDELCLCLQAGGASSRMGTDKALKSFCGEPLIEHVLRRVLAGELSVLSGEIIITTNHADLYRFMVERYRPKLRLEGDVVSGKGALGGLYTALMRSASRITAVVACDLPFADGDLLATGYRWMAKREWDAFVPRTQAGMEPLHALYRTRACLPFVEEALAEGLHKVTAWFARAKIFFYDFKEKEPSPFFNVNTREEFAQAEKWAQTFDDIENRG